MNRVMVVAAGLVFAIGIADASAKASQKKTQGHRGSLVQRDVGMGVRNVGAPYGIPANGDLKYGPQPFYPQSPIGGA